MLAYIAITNQIVKIRKKIGFISFCFFFKSVNKIPIIAKANSIFPPNTLIIPITDTVFNSATVVYTFGQRLV